MPLAAITFAQIIELLVLFAIVNGVIAAPIIIAVIGAFGERVDNQDHQPRV